MLHKTSGIVFHRFKYSESSIIAKIYTEQFGLCSYLIQGGRKKKSPVKASFLQPLSLVELVAYHKETSGLQKMKEIKNSYPFVSIPNDILKTSIAIFLSEMLSRSIKEETPNKQKFDFIFNAIKTLDSLENPVDFHLIFLLKLSKFLGFYPQGSYSEKNPFFNLAEGNFTSEKTHLHHFISSEISKIFAQILNAGFFENFSLTGDARKILLEKIIDYYRLHLTGLQEIKSHHVLETVLRD